MCSCATGYWHEQSRILLVVRQPVAFRPRRLGSWYPNLKAPKEAATAADDAGDLESEPDDVIVVDSKGTAATPKAAAAS